MCCMGVGSMPYLSRSFATVSFLLAHVATCLSLDSRDNPMRVVSFAVDTEGTVSSADSADGDKGAILLDDFGEALDDYGHKQSKYDYDYNDYGALSAVLQRCRTNRRRRLGCCDSTDPEHRHDDRLQCTDPGSGNNDPEPTQPGCYLKVNRPGPGTCSEDSNSGWQPDEWGKVNRDSWASEAACKARKAGHDRHCGSDTTWVYVGSRGGDGTSGGNTPGGGGSGFLRVMSYNTQYNNYASRMAGYGRKIAEVGPAVVGTQECQDKNGLARTSGYNNVPDTDFQNPIFYNPANVSYVAGSAGWMPVTSDTHAPRTITWAKFRLGSTEFWFFNTQLPRNLGAAASTNTHARIAQRLLEKRRALGAENMPTVVTGDMNTFASNGASEGTFESNLVAAGFEKSYQARGNTGGLANLDQIFHTHAHFRLLSGSDQGTGGSDHPAIIADLELQ